MYDLGDTVTVTASCYNAAGQLANAGTAALTVTLPDGTTDTPAPANPPAVTGQYTHPYVAATQAGRYTARWLFSGGLPAQAWTDVFDIAPANPVALVELAEAKHFLNIPPANTAHDEKLRSLIASVTDVVEDITGVVVRRSFTEVYSGFGEPAILLRRRPVISVTSVSENGVALAASEYSVNSFGVLTKATSYAAGRWLSGVDNIGVTYVAGRLAPTPSILDGARDLIRVNFRPVIGGNHSVFDGGRADEAGQSQEPGSIRLGFFVPNSVMQRLTPSARPPHVA